MPIKVEVRDGNVGRSMMQLKRTLIREGLFKEMKLRRHYEKPSVKKKRIASEVLRRKKKFQRRY